MRRALLGALLVATAACAPRGAVDAADPRIRYEGRVVPDWRGRVRFAWPRTAMHLRFTGTGLTARIHDEPEEDARGSDAISVQVDGGAARRITLTPGTRDYALARGLSPGEHSLRVAKLTEAGVGTVRVHRVVPQGGGVLARPGPRRHRLLAVGDSITAGYGVHQPDGPCGVALARGDASESWASRAADALDAELHMIAWSGRGLTRNYDPDGEPTMAQLFDRAIPTERWSRYDLRAYVPDVVVVNLGTNDASTPGFDDAAYRAALDAFVSRLQSLYPRAQVVLAVGPLLHDDIPAPGCMSRRRVYAITAAVVQTRNARAGAHVTLLDLPEAPPDEGYGCDHHPSPRTHARMAAQLVRQVRGEPSSSVGP